MADEFVEGYSVREDMWHDLEGQFTKDRYPADAEEAARWSGHNFTVVERPVWVDLADPTSDEVQMELVEGQKALVRQPDNGKPEGVLSVVSDSYGVAQPSDMWEVLEALLAPPKGSTDTPPVVFETGGCLRGYRQIWALAKIDRAFYVHDGDSPFYPYIAMMNSFDGSSSLRAMPTAVRVVCKNTADAAEMGAKAAGNVYSFRHTANVSERIEDAKAVIFGVVETVQEFMDMSRELLAMPVTAKQIDTFLERFVPMPVTEAAITDRAAQNIHEARAAVKNILAGGTGTVLAQQSGTAYGLVQAATEYLDHVRKAQSAESRFKRSFLEPDDSKARVIEFARTAASA